MAGGANAAVLFRSMAEAVEPAPDITIAEWAEQKRYVSAESGSPYPGLWQNSRAPHLVEIQECLSFNHPARDVVFVKSHQVAGTEAGINLIGYGIDQHPCSMLVVMASLDEGSKYVKVKLQPTIDATPALRHKVKDQRSRSEQGSTTSQKRFAGGFLQVTGANSAKGLKMISAKVLVCDEISDWPYDVDNQGDPLSMAEKRTTAHSHSCKRFYVSTPSLKGQCRITEKYEASDMRRFYVQCPQCGDWQYLTWDQMQAHSERPPYRTYLKCKSNGCVIEHYQKGPMLDGAKWIKTYPDADPANPAPAQVIPKDKIDYWRARSSRGRCPGFHIWQAYSKFVDWDDTMHQFIEAQGKPEKEKDFTQQVLGEAFEEQGEAPDVEDLVKRVEDYPFRVVPPNALVLTGFADVQGNRLEYGVYAWGIGLEGWLIDKGIIEGDPQGEEVWKRLDEVVGAEYQGWQGRPFKIEAFGVDSGYLSNEVYRFCRGRERVFACDGVHGWTQPHVGTPKKMDITWQGRKIPGGVMKYPLGTFPLKSWVYAALRKYQKGVNEEGRFDPGTLHFPKECDKEFFEQITAEYVAEKENKRGHVERVWKRLKNRPNEQLDIAVGARAMAFQLGLDHVTPEGWLKLAQERGAPLEKAQQDLADLWAPKPGAGGGEQSVKDLAARLARIGRKH